MMMMKDAQAATRITALVRRAFARETVYQALLKDWERIYDPLTGGSYYYNRETDVAQWNRPAPLLWRDLPQAPTFTDEQAALFVQCAWRRKVDKREATKRLAKVLTKELDEQSNTYYYVNSLTGTTSWEIPALLGAYDIDNDGQLVGLPSDDDEEGDEEEEEEEDEASSSEGGDDDDDDESSFDPALAREWPRSRAQQIVDAVEDGDDEETLGLRGLGLTRLTYRIFEVGTLTHLDVSGNKLTKLPEDMGSLENLRVLDVSGNRLTSLPKELEDLGECLRTLRAANNVLESFSPHVYRLRQLETFDLEGNRLRQVPVVVGDLDLLKETRIWEVGPGMLESLTSLNLRRNLLNVVPGQLDQLLRLEDLDLSQNNLTTLTIPDYSTNSPAPAPSDENQAMPPLRDDGGAAWGKLSKLRRLDVSGNAVDEVPGGIAGLPGLEMLDLRENRLTALPEMKAPKLKVIRVDGNWLREFPPLATLQSVDASNNLIEAISFAGSITSIDLMKNKLQAVDIGGLSKSLTALNLSENLLGTFPKAIGSLVRLKVLKLASNKFKGALSGKVFVSLVSLEDLDISGNAITEVPKQLLNLERLSRLILRKNKIHKIDMSLLLCGGDPKKKKVAVLRHLDLAHNDLTTFPLTSTSSVLETLHLDHNKLTTLPTKELGLLPKLRCLTFDHNPIARDIVDVLDPLDEYRDRVPWRSLRVCLLPRQEGTDVSEKVQRERERRKVLKDASIGAERLECGEFDDALRPLGAAVATYEDLLHHDMSLADTAEHHFFLGAADLARIRCLERKEDDDDYDELDDIDAMDRDRERPAQTNGAWEKERREALERCRRTCNLAIRIRDEARLTPRYPEALYCRAVASMALKDVGEAIRDLSRVLLLRPTHVPSILLRAKARTALGQYPQAKRDCLKVRKLVAKEVKEVDEALEKLRLAPLEREILQGVEALQKMGCDDPTMERVFEVTPAGCLVRRKAELMALETTGRSLARSRRERATALKETKRLAIEEKRRMEDSEHTACSLLADRVRADLAARKARYQQDLDEVRKRQRKEKEARLRQEQEEAARLERERQARNQEDESKLMAIEDKRSALAFGHDPNKSFKAAQKRADEDDLQLLKKSRSMSRRRLSRRQSKASVPRLSSRNLGGGGSSSQRKNKG